MERIWHNSKSTKRQIVTLVEMQKTQLKWESLSTGQLLVIHSTNLIIMGEWWEERCCWRKAIRNPICSKPQAMWETKQMWKKVLWSYESKTDLSGQSVKQCSTVCVAKTQHRETQWWLHHAEGVISSVGTGKLVSIVTVDESKYMAIL